MGWKSIELKRRISIWQLSFIGRLTSKNGGTGSRIYFMYVRNGTCQSDYGIRMGIRGKTVSYVTLNKTNL